MLNLSVAQAAQKLKTKEISAVELTKVYLDQIEKHKDLNAYITVTKHQALKAAENADKNIASGNAKPLEGIPLGIKDLFCTKDVKTTAASKILDNFVPPYESTVTKKLWDSGAIMLGKLNMDEFAMGATNTYSAYGPVVNPWRDKSAPSKALVSGGSSGGSAVAVASKMALATLGSDTGGSVRQPASFCGVVGIKPTYGLCSRFGMIAFASSLDQAGVLARNVNDASMILETIAGYDPKDGQSLKVDIPKYSQNLNSDVEGKRIAVFEEFFEGLNSESHEFLTKSIKWFENAGAKIDVIKFPILSYALPVYYIIAPAEASSNLARYDGVLYGVRQEGGSIEEMIANTRSIGFGAEVKRRILIGTYVLSSAHYDAYYIKAQKVRQSIIGELEKIFTVYDVILSLTTPTPAFPIEEEISCPETLYLQDVYTVLANLAKLPAISVPVGLSGNGLPMGVQILGPQLQEQVILNMAKFIEEMQNG